MGTATDLYERPASEFVADFLGTSNLIDLDGRRVMIRPERIQILSDGQMLDTSKWCIQSAVVQERAFVGPFTRYLVRLEDDAELLVFQQNTNGSDTSGLNDRGAAVRIAWQQASVYQLPQSGKTNG